MMEAQINCQKPAVQRKTTADDPSTAPCGLRVVRIDPLRFLAGCRTRRLNQVQFLFYILACFNCIVA